MSRPSLSSLKQLEKKRKRLIFLITLPILPGFFFSWPFLFSPYARDNARVPHASRLVKRKSARICTRKLHRLRSPSTGLSAHYREELGTPCLSDSISPLPISLLSAPAAHSSSCFWRTHRLATLSEKIEYTNNNIFIYNQSYVTFWHGRKEILNVWLHDLFFFLCI